MKKSDDDRGADGITFLIVACVIFVIVVLTNTRGLPLPHLLVPP